MHISVREADINADRNILIEFLFHNLTEQSNELRFDWLYRNNPFGTARVWILFHEDSERIIGSAAAFPRLMRICGDDFVCWNLGDFAIDSRCRTLGPALVLQRACLAPIQEGKIPLSYDHPSKSMMTIYRRMGIPASGQIIRFAKPLRIDAKVEKYVKAKTLARPFSALGNLFIQLGANRRHVYRGYEVDVLQGRFNEEFSRLDDSVSSHFEVYGRRTAEYLNWRYLDNPLRQYVVMTLRNEGKLMAYAVLTQVEEDARLIDFWGEQQGEIAEALMSAVIEMVRQHRIRTLSAPLLNSNPLIPLVRRVGFFPREVSPWVVCTKTGGDLEGVVTEKKNWFLTDGDRDI